MRNDMTPTTDDIMADLFCAQVQTECDMGDSVFNAELYPELTGDEYADAILSTLAWLLHDSVL